MFCSQTWSWIFERVTRIMQWLSFSSEKNRNQKKNAIWASIEDCDNYSIPIGNVKKWVPNSFDKEKYMSQYENLKLYLRLGLELKKIHRILEFNQSQWLKQYVDFNTQQRKTAGKKGQRCKSVIQIN